MITDEAFSHRKAEMEEFIFISIILHGFLWFLHHLFDLPLYDRFGFANGVNNPNRFSLLIGWLNLLESWNVLSINEK